MKHPVYQGLDVIREMINELEDRLIAAYPGEVTSDKMSDGSTIGVVRLMPSRKRRLCHIQPTTAEDGVGTPLAECGALEKLKLIEEAIPSLMIDLRLKSEITSKQIKQAIEILKTAIEDLPAPPKEDV